MSRYLAVVLLLALAGCEKGDWLGPVERGARGLFNGWDMWDTEAVRPYEAPMPAAVPGTVATADRFSLAAGKRELAQIPRGQRAARAAQAYRRYCHHCHGASGDGRTIVGESLDAAPTDLRSEGVQELETEDMFSLIREGGSAMPPLADTLSPAEMLLVIEHVRTLAGGRSRPVYGRQSARPIR